MGHQPDKWRIVRLRNGKLTTNRDLIFLLRHHPDRWLMQLALDRDKLPITTRRRYRAAPKHRSSSLWLLQFATHVIDQQSSRAGSSANLSCELRE